jgi:hypothetical protein
MLHPYARLGVRGRLSLYRLGTCGRGRVRSGSNACTPTAYVTSAGNVDSNAAREGRIPHVEPARQHKHKLWCKAAVISRPRHHRHKYGCKTKFCASEMPG